MAASYKTWGHLIGKRSQNVVDVTPLSSGK
jgi:hypothetical protein